MDKKICLMHANCQGEELETLLGASAAFSSIYRIVRRTNYTREPVSREDLSSCSLFLYQRLDARWGELSSQALLGGLSGACRALPVPNMFFKAYWPFWTPDGPIDFGDSLLNRLIDEGAPKEAILRVYLRADLNAFADLRAGLEQTLKAEADKDPENVFGISSFIRENWKKRRLFHTVNHPGGELLIRAAQSVLRRFALPPLSGAEIARAQADGVFPSYADFDLPIHPGVAAFHGLNFAAPGSRFNVFGRLMTFEQYVSRYIDCRRNGFGDNFIGYLQMV
ncbi:MAG: hypothetical protein LBU06_03865 [Desulfovibrio sp.]|jgi:hypothetical protein|nr:hypothetical protein [Desulfovibrio sp.]